ncbi:DUF559 domain-containing protein [Natronosporangium hydrolyticum]|uniref:DUF559 domain-containing protein n=1 Tax=Natronosporangium hydrolyticum TaxID=2811111 RepID=A0A895YG04_9ACTN|nr:DUF559 domain-containing protein [Natronosporangium hydrolyticum]QSB16747.1 DUF559 domain-containing protein [Natronosporangium hydrolyticum]
MVLSLAEIPTDQVVWIKDLYPDDVDRAVATAPPDAPAVIVQRPTGPWRQRMIVAGSLDNMEVVAGQLFPAWLPAAEGITTSAGAAPAAVRAVAIEHAASTSQYGPFLADLAAGALARSVAYTGRHHPEVRALGLARVLAASFGRSTCALLLRPPHDLDEGGSLALTRAAQWLVDHGRLAVWICGGALPAVEHPPEAVVAQPVGNASAKVGRPRPRSLVGKPHPTSRAEVALETALAGRSWAAGRAWNQTVRPGPLINPVRVDLLWQRERCIVEIDGDDHRTVGKYTEDRTRDVMLQLNGYAVLRFTNSQVLDDIESVLAILQQFLATRRRAGKGN